MPARRRLLLGSLALTLAFGALPLAAQPRTGSAPASSDAPAGSGSPAPVEPAPPAVDDPMLAPIPAAEHTLGDWRQARAMVRGNTTALALAVGALEQSRGQTRTTQARMLPTLTSTTTLTHQLLTQETTPLFPPGAPTTTSPEPTTFSSSLSLRVPVLALQAWYDTATARRNERSARLRVKDAERLVLAAAASAIVSVVTAERLAEVSRVSLRSGLENAELYRRRRTAGAASDVDVLRAEQDVAIARDQLLRSDDSVYQAREQLGQALGAEEAWGVTPDLRLDLLRTDATSSCRRVAGVESRADVRAARSSLDVAERGSHSADLLFFPTADAVSTLTYVDPARGGQNPTWSVGGVLTWQLYDGGARYGGKAQARAQLHVARAQLRDTRRKARYEVTQAERGVRIALAAQQVSQRSRELAREGARIARVAFANGKGTSFDLIDTARRAREAELDYAVKEFNVAQAQIAALIVLSECDV